MSRRRKLEKFADLLRYQNVYEMTQPGSPLLRRDTDTMIDLRGKWKNQVFESDFPLCLELACGRGEYSVGLARIFPEKNFIGVDIKGARIHKGATIALQDKLSNVCFLRTRIEQINLYFDIGEVDEIWITFPDPFPSKENRRLTSKIFLDKYLQLLRPQAKVHLKTDDDDLFEFSMTSIKEHPSYEIREECKNISELRKSRPELNILTYYEKEHLLNKKTIKYLQLEKID